MSHLDQPRRRNGQFGTVNHTEPVEGTAALTDNATVYMYVVEVPDDGTFADKRVVVYATSDEEVFEAFYTNFGIEAYIESRQLTRNAAETIEQSMTRLAEANHMALIARERNGQGPGARKTTDRGFVHDFKRSAPEDVHDAYNYLGIGEYWLDEHGEESSVWPHIATLTDLPADQPVHTGQDFVSGTHLDKLAQTPDHEVVRDGVYVVPGSGDKQTLLPKIYIARDGRTWCLDGHHTICAARDRGLPCRVQQVNYATFMNIKPSMVDVYGEDGDEDYD